ncbi:MAG: c-type cytochrome, partial [Actinomycetota bacterium]
MRPYPAVVLLAGACAVLGGCGYVGRDIAPSHIDVREVAIDGKTLYLRDCAWCHGDDGEGTARGPDLISGTNGEAFTDFMLSTGRMPIESPTERTQREDPAYERDEIDAIVAHVATLGGTGPEVPEPDPEGADLAEGLELYQENCAACHSTTMVGGALTTGPEATSGSLVAPSLRESSDREIAEAMLVGPGAMPVFGRETFTEDQVNSIVAYVAALQDPTDRGGAPIGHVGPVTEGAVGWIVGLGGLLLLIR